MALLVTSIILLTSTYLFYGVKESAAENIQMQNLANDALLVMEKTGALNDLVCDACDQNATINFLNTFQPGVCAEVTIYHYTKQNNELSQAGSFNKNGCALNGTIQRNVAWRSFVRDSGSGVEMYAAQMNLWRS